jgi:lipid-A-disaccharide synthase
MRYYIISGEASGDLHGSNLVRALNNIDLNADIRAWGGELMQAEGAYIVKHYKDLAFMGFVEVLMNINTIINNLNFCKEDIVAYQPDVIILIDYPGFNLRIAKWAKAQGIKVVYYISPQIWAWKEGRVKQIKQYVDKMLVILPFEKAFYKKHDYNVDYVGHPLLEVVERNLKVGNDNNISNKPIIALLPGSRTQEIKVSLPIMLSIVEQYPDYDFVIAQAPSQPENAYLPFIQFQNVKLIKGKTYDILKNANAALVTSGTATLETALFGVPQVVCYKGNKISYWLAKKLIKVKYISLVNLILDKPAVKELIQAEFNMQLLKEELDSLLYDADRIDKMQSDYTKLWELLAMDDYASNNAAKIIHRLLQS